MYFDKILIANRGEIAVRIIRACHELGITAVAVYSEADRSAMHVRLADEAYPIGPAPATASYLNVGRIIEVARRSGAQAIHPGYGFLAEQAHFAQACQEAGLVFIGPPPEAIALLGSKIAAKRLAESAGVPIVPGYMGDDQSPEKLRWEAARLGFPLLIKASAGGGGKGMRTVASSAEFDAALEGARREARAAFGDDAVFLERLIVRPRHVEVQVLADAHGNCIHLFERECSIQRRHQKIIEESPSPALTPELRAQMGAAAVRLAQAAGYRNAGTVEFMLDQQGHYYFLEVNTRLQVEHPVTELVTGVDLVHLQIAVAAGEALPLRQEELAQRGHAIEARVYAEDPATFLPATGRVALFAPPEGPGVRNDVGLESGDEVVVHYDPLLAKLIVYAPDRPAAIARLRRALDDYAVLGVTTNLPLLRAIAGHPDFAAGATHTDFLVASGLAGVAFEPQHPPPKVLAAAAIADLDAIGFGGTAVQGVDGGSAAPTGDRRPVIDPWRVGPWQVLRDGIRLRYLVDNQEYLVTATQTSTGWRLEIGEAQHEVTVVVARPNQLVLASGDAGGQRRTERFWIARVGSERLVGWRGASFRLARAAALNVDTLGVRAGGARGHAGLEAPMPGTVIKVLVHEGQEVTAHQPLVVLEAMKMEHVVAAPGAGVVRRLPYGVGALVAKGATLVELEER
jgi:3-methylcrotonyl-CoA carboxylase alpha subunit